MNKNMGQQNRRVRVLHILQNLHYGGMERVINEIVKHVDAQRIESHVMGLQYLGRFADDLAGKASLHTGGKSWRGWSMLWPRSLIKQISQIQPDVVHSHSGVWYKASLAAYYAGVPKIIHTDHGRTFPVSRLTRFTDALAIKRTQHFVAVSEALAAQLLEVNKNFAAIQQVIINGVDTRRYQPADNAAAQRSALGIPAENMVIGSIGRLEHVKGYDTVLDAYALLLKQWPVEQPIPYLLIAGDGAARATLEAQIVALGLQSTVRLLGWRDDIQALLASFDVYTMGSRSEGTSVSLLEAMCCGLCPVVTDVGGNSAVMGELLKHCLVPAEDPQALSRAWHQLLTDENRRYQDGLTARKIVLEQYSVQKMVDAYQCLYLS